MKHLDFQKRKNKDFERKLFLLHLTYYDQNPEKFLMNVDLHDQNPSYHFTLGPET